MPGSTIITTLTHGVSLGSAAYASPLTITSTGAVDPISIAAGESAAVYGDGVVINNGTILSGNGASAASLTGISLFGGITNNGLIGGGIYIASYSSITNFGTISGFATNGSGVSVSIDAGGTGETITNFGTIIGGVEMYSGTVINAGTIDGNGGYAIHSVTDFQGFKLVVEPGAVFIGDVIPGTEEAPNAVLELAGTSTTALTGIGSSFQYFNKLSFATGAAWTAEGALTSLQISGFTSNDTLVLDGFTATSDTYVAGTGLVLNNSTGTTTLDITGGSLSTASFMILDQSGSTEILRNDAGADTIAGTVTTSITLNTGNYLSPLTIASTGVVSPAAAGAAGIYAASGIVINHGSVAAGAGASSAGPAQSGGTGIILDNAALINFGAVTGGLGGGGGAGGAGVSLQAGSLTNAGTITGGAGAIDAGAGGVGGAGLYLQGGAATNSGSIIGGTGGASMYGKVGYPGGAGIMQKAGQLTNTGTIIGGVSDTALKPGYGGNGLIMSGGSTENQGLIEGGKIDSTYQRNGIGLYLLEGTLTNDGRIDGATSSHTGGLGVHVINGTLINETDGIIAGGAGTSTGGGSVRISGTGTIENYGTISTGTGPANGYGALILSGSFINAGALTGGLDLDSYRSGTDAGATNTGSIAGGVFVGGGALNNKTSGIIQGGITLESNSIYQVAVLVSNAGTIVAAKGGIGALLLSGILVNNGDITGGVGAGDGVSIGISDLVNSGVIIAGASNAGPAPTAPGGIGVNATFQATFSNTGTIIGGSGGAYNNGGDGVHLGVSSGFNSGLIEGGFGSIGGTALYLSDATFINAGTIEAGQGAAAGDAISLGSRANTLIADPGAVFDGAVIAVASLGNELDLAAGTPAAAGTLDMGGSFSGLGTIVFDIGAAWNLSGTAAELAGGEKIAGFTAPDALILEGFTATSHTYVSGAGLELSDGATTETIDLFGGFSTNSFIVTNTAAGTEIQLCYLRGTRIATPAGEVPIETLNIGDTIITRYNGYRRIKWIGRQSYAARFVKNNRDQLPVRIAAGALRPNLPRRNLSVSPGHSMLLGGVLILARNLVNGVTITQESCPEEIHYYQLEFDSHDCVLAEGCWSESFCDYAGLRNQFHNAADFHRRYSDYVTPGTHIMCAPRPQAGPALEAALRPIAARAAVRTSLGPLQGWIDSVDPFGTITGWAQDLANPRLPVLLEILSAGRILGSILACDYRPDLAPAGIAEGRAAFTFTAPARRRLARSTLAIRRTADQAELPMAPHCLALPARRRRQA